MKLAKADLFLTEVNLRGEYASFTALEAACAAFCEEVDAGRTGSPAGAGGDARRGAGPPAPGARLPVHRGAGGDPPGGRDVAGDVRGRPVLGAAPAGGAAGACPPARGAGCDRPRRPGRGGRSGPPPGDVAGQPAPGGCALPACPARGAEPGAETPHRGRGGVPRDRVGAGCGWARPPQPEPAGSGPRWPGPSSSPPCTGPWLWTGHSGRPPQRAGSPTATWPRSWPTRLRGTRRAVPRRGRPHPRPGHRRLGSRDGRQGEGR